MSDGQGLLEEFDSSLRAHELGPAARRLQVQRTVGIEAEATRESAQHAADGFL